MTKADLTAVWGRNENDVWVGGENVVLHFDGKRWSTVVELNRDTARHTKIVAITACGSSTFVGGGRQLLRLDDRGAHPYETLERTFDRMTGRYVRGVVCGPDANDVRVISTTGAVLRPDGERWSNVEAAGYEHLNALWVSEDAGLFAVGEDGMILHGPPLGLR